MSAAAAFYVNEHTTPMGATLALVAAELDKAMGRFASFNSGHEGWAVIKEELDELWEHVRAGTEVTDDARDEAVQVAAMALRYVLDLCDPLRAAGGVRFTADNEKLQAAELERELGYGAAVDIVEQRAEERIKALNGELGDALSKQALTGGLLADYKAEVARYRTTLEALMTAVENHAATRAVDAELGAGEWEAFIPETVWVALEAARAALAGENTP